MPLIRYIITFKTFYKMEARTIIAQYVKEMRKKYKLTQIDLSEKAGVGLRFVRELEQGLSLYARSSRHKPKNAFVRGAFSE